MNTDYTDRTLFIMANVYRLSRIAISTALVLFLFGCSDHAEENHEQHGAASHQHGTAKTNAHDRHTQGQGHDHGHEHDHGGKKDHHHGHAGHAHETPDNVRFSATRVAGLGITIDTLPVRALSETIKVNGRLALFPQHRATVTAILGANVTAIEVIEGETVKKGQILATLSHPNLTNLQTAYIRTYNQMQFLEKEYEREKRLYEAGVSSGKTYQQTRADFLAIKGEVIGYEAQLHQLNIDARKIRTGKVLQNVPVVSPIDGNIEKVLIQLGQFVDPNTTLFMVINLDHIHADLMVFEKNIAQVKKGQKVSFKVESVPGKTLTARIFSVGKNFERTPRAVHTHAKIDQQEDFLIPGMYIHGEIHTGDAHVTALPADAVFREEDKSYIFTATARREAGKTDRTDWIFKPVEVYTGVAADGWLEVNPVEQLPENAKVAWSKAYYLIAEMKKGEAAHEH